MQEDRIADAEKILEGSIQELEQKQPSSPKLANYLARLSLILLDKGHFADAAKVSRRALAIDQIAFGATDIRVASDMTWLGGLLSRQGEPEEGERLLEQAVEIARLYTGSREEVVNDRKAIIFIALGEMYMAQKRWPEAEFVMKEVPSFCELVRHPPPPCENTLRDLDKIYEAEGKAANAGNSRAEGLVPREVVDLNRVASEREREGAFAEAGEAYRNAVAFIEKNQVERFPELLSVELDLLAQSLEKQGLNDQAESAYLRALESKERAAAGPYGKMAIHSFNFNGLINLYRGEGRLGDVEPLMRHALELQEEFLGAGDVHVAPLQVDLADVYQEDAQGDDKMLAEARKLYESALEIQEEKLGRDHVQLLRVLGGYLRLLRKTNDNRKASEVEVRISEIQKTLDNQKLMK